MWLLDTTSRMPHSFLGDDIPPYAILSHTWGTAELSFQDLRVVDEQLVELDRPVAGKEEEEEDGEHEDPESLYWAREGERELLQSDLKTRSGYRKIAKCCDQALADGYKYAWIDTCCIDKTNSSELSEAINSMFKWYQNSAKCYAYLEDVEPGGSIFDSSRRTSRWFTRGWTLQELLAPSNLVFFDGEWNAIGTKTNFSTEIHNFVGIPSDILVDYQQAIQRYSVAQIMSWAANRQTTRIEDRAYSLLGLFGVSMPMLYGEGEEAFARLQLEIIKISTDHSIFAWMGDGHDSGPFATSPQVFAGCSDIWVNTQANDLAYEMTNLGLRIRLYLSSEVRAGERHELARWASLNCVDTRRTPHQPEPVGIWLKELNRGQHYSFTNHYIRTNTHNIHAPTQGTLDLELAEIHFADPRRRSFDRFRTSLISSQPQMKQVCMITFQSLQEEGYTLKDNSFLTQINSKAEVSEHEVAVELHKGNRTGILHFQHVNTKVKKKPRSFQVVLSLRSDGVQWWALETVTNAGEQYEDFVKLKGLWKRASYGQYSSLTLEPSGYQVRLVARHILNQGKLVYSAWLYLASPA